MVVYLGQWDCKYCTHKGVPGPNTHCTQCGASRSDKVRFYLPENAEQITDEEVLEEANAGPNWACSNCHSSNKHWNEFCGSCGSAFSTDDKDTILAERSYNLNDVPNSSTDKAEPVEVKQRTTLSPKKKKMGIFALLSGLVFSFLSTFNSTIEVDVTGHEWQRTLHIQQYINVQEEGWNIPQGGKEIERFKAIHHYNEVFRGYETRTRTVREKVGTEQYLCGKKDLGNGYFEDKHCTRDVYRSRQESYQHKVYDRIPIHKTKYRYSIFRWKADQPIVTQGTDHQPKWGTKVGLDDPKRFRITKKSAEYSVQVKDHKGELHYEKFELKQWQKINKGTKLPAIKSTIYGYYKSLDREKIEKIK